MSTKHLAGFSRIQPNFIAP